MLVFSRDLQISVYFSCRLTIAKFHLLGHLYHFSFIRSTNLYGIYAIFNPGAAKMREVWYSWCAVKFNVDKPKMEMRNFIKSTTITKEL